MASTQTKSALIRDTPSPIQTVDFSSIQANIDETITLVGPAGLAPDHVSFAMINSADDNSLLYGVHDPDNDAQSSATLGSSTRTGSDTVSVRFHTTGDPTGAIMRVRIEWAGSASGGIS